MGALLGGACNGETVEPTSSDGTVGCELGSEDCACLDGGLCDPGLLCASKTCVPSVDPSETTSSTSTTSDPTTSDPTTSGSTTMVVFECDPEEGLVSEKCAAVDSRYPYCNNAGVCVDCTGLEACGEELSVCDPEEGKCVLCIPGDAEACVDQTPVCDGETHACVPCIAHDECGDAACNLFTGECFDDDAILWVDSQDPGCSASGGTEEEPLCELGEAIAETAAGKDWTIRLAGGPYTGAFVIPASYRIAVVNPAAESSSIMVKGLEMGEPIINVEPAATAIFDGLTLQGDVEANPDANLHGLLSNNARLWIDRSRVASNSGRGLTANISEVVARGVVLTGNLGGGILTAGAGTLRVENSFVTHNGSNSVKAGAVAVNDGEVDMVYTTIVGNSATLGFSTEFTCVDATEAVVRNSVIVGIGDAVDCMGADLTYSVVDEAVGMDNYQIDPQLLGSFFAFDDGIYRALAMTGIEEVALWLVGDPGSDFEGDTRPFEPESPDYPGADLP